MNRSIAILTLHQCLARAHARGLLMCFRVHNQNNLSNIFNQHGVEVLTNLKMQSVDLNWRKLVHENHIRCVRLACQPTSQQYCSLIPNQHQPPATSQSAVLFSHNKSAPAISHSQANTAYNTYNITDKVGVNMYINISV